MFDPFDKFVYWVTRFCSWIAGGLAFGVNRALVKSFQESNTSPGEQTKITKLHQDENARMAGCREVVLSYANHLGYIAREVITRAEIDRLIDSGISPQTLADEIETRIDEYPGVILGHQSGLGHQIKLPYSYRNRHMYIIGRSGSGKSNTIRQIIMQDILNGFGVGVLAPEAEMLTEEILPYIPEERIDDVVYFNPADMELPIAINPLYLEEGEDIDQYVDDLITIFSRLTSDLSPRMREIMYHTFYGLLERPGSTLLDVEILLDKDDPSIRNEVIATTDNPRTARFFDRVFPTLSRDACLPVYTRIAQLISPRRVRNLLCQPGKSFNFRDAMDEGRILLFNLSDGILGEQTSQLLGQLIVAKIQLAVMSRAELPKHLRRPFYLYLDEFQTFVETSQNSYEKILSRSRKYNFGVCLANQQTAQIPNNLLQGILGNVSTMIAFNLSANDANKLSQELVVEFDGKMERLPPEELLRLSVGQAIAKIGRTVFPLTTALADQHPDMAWAKAIIERSRIQYGSPVSRSRKALNEPQPKTEPHPLPRPFLELPDDDDIDISRVF